MAAWCGVRVVCVDPPPMSASPLPHPPCSVGCRVTDLLSETPEARTHHCKTTQQGQHAAVTRPQIHTPCRHHLEEALLLVRAASRHCGLLWHCGGVKTWHALQAAASCTHTCVNQLPRHVALLAKRVFAELDADGAPVAAGQHRTLRNTTWPAQGRERDTHTTGGDGHSLVSTAETGGQHTQAAARRQGLQAWWPSDTWQQHCVSLLRCLCWLPRCPTACRPPSHLLCGVALRCALHCLKLHKAADLPAAAQHLQLLEAL